jgi:uncharacterized repeat protein (TIGR01451 family)
MKYLKSAFVFAISGCMTSAFAGAGILTTTVTALQDTVTYSKPASSKSPALTTYIGYTVSVKNEGGNTINNIRFTGTTSVTDGAEKALFGSAEGAYCVTPIADDKTAIECSIGQLTAGQVINFAVFFLAPENKAPLDVQNIVTFAGATLYAEGTGGINSVPDNSIKEWICAPSPTQVTPTQGPTVCQVALGTPDPVRIRSSVTKNGGDLFTGDGAVTTAADRFSTRVNIPAGAAYTTAEIVESALIGDCTFLIVCDQVRLTIPPPAGATVFTPYLTIVLREDATNIKKGTKIASVLLEYLPDEYADGTPYAGGPVLIDECASGPVPPSPTAQEPFYKPCIAKRTVYKRNTSGWTPDLDGDFEWTLVSYRNGSIAIRR